MVLNSSRHHSEKDADDEGIQHTPDGQEEQEITKDEKETFSHSNIEDVRISQDRGEHLEAVTTVQSHPPPSLSLQQETETIHHPLCSMGRLLFS